MLFQQVVALAPLEAMLIAAVAMSLGLLSYYLAGATSAHGHHTEGMTAADGAAAGTAAPGSADDAPPGRVRIPETSAPDVMPAPGHRLTQRFLTSMKKGQSRAQPIVEMRGPTYDGGGRA